MKQVRAGLATGQSTVACAGIATACFAAHVQWNDLCQTNPACILWLAQATSWQCSCHAQSGRCAWRPAQLAQTPAQTRPAYGWTLTSPDCVLLPFSRHVPWLPHADAAAAEGLQGLQARINEMRDTQGPAGAAAAGVGAGASSSGSGSSWSSSGSNQQQLPGGVWGGGAEDGESLDATASFSDAEDSEVSEALSRRIRQIATTTGEWGSSMDEEEMRQPLTGEVRLHDELSLLVQSCQLTSCLCCQRQPVACCAPLQP